jgi:pimeloyl-ACP methyl ester carboxylesterase
MIQLRTYGNPPFSVALVHGGPGAGGEMAPVARRLSDRFGVLEPIQTATSLPGQVTELSAMLKDPGLVRKLILVSSGPFEEQYVAILKQNREMRLTQAESLEFARLVEQLASPDTPEKDDLLAGLGLLADKTDMYDPLPVDVQPDDEVELNGRIFHSVWNEADEMRRTGRLLELAEKIACPVVAIHGDYDPHPAEGVRLPLAARLKDFKFILLEHCGHTPWHERQAQLRFYQHLYGELEE